MKRIIQCPHCEAKLSVFDIGKPISQKCPKCGKAINAESEVPSSGDQNEDKAAPAVTSCATNQSRPADKTVGDGNASETLSSSADVKSSNKIPPDITPARPSAPEFFPNHAHQGSGGLFKAVVIGALIIIIAMQIIAKFQSDKRYNTLNENLKTIAKKIGN